MRTSPHFVRTKQQEFLEFPNGTVHKLGCSGMNYRMTEFQNFVPEFIQEQFGVVVGILMNSGNSGIVLGTRAPPHLVFPEQPHLSSLPSIKNQQNFSFRNEQL